MAAELGDYLLWDGELCVVGKVEEVSGRVLVLDLVDPDHEGYNEPFGCPYCGSENSVEVVEGSAEFKKNAKPVPTITEGE